MNKLRRVTKGLAENKQLWRISTNSSNQHSTKMNSTMLKHTMSRQYSKPVENIEKKNHHDRDHHRHQTKGTRKTIIPAIAAVVIIFYNLVLSKKVALADDSEQKLPGEYKEGLEDFTFEQVAKHNSPETGIWVIFRNGVYDITEFVKIHPGGDRIKLAYGKEIDPFWKLYPIHFQSYVFDLLSSFRIGNIHPDEKAKHFKAPTKTDEPYGQEPERHPALTVHTETPFNSESPTEILTDNFITPNELFYIRNHMPVPLIDEEAYRLTIDGLGIDEKMFSLEDLKSMFPKREVVATVQCAGNRRTEMNKTGRKVNGTDWQHGAISNAKWAGASLRDILTHCGVQIDPTSQDLVDPIQQGIQHVWFEGLDIDPIRSGYGSSIEIEKALDAHGDVILAYEMNGEPIPRDHGFPIRAIVPGHVGARMVKWLGKVHLDDKESPSHWQQKDYKGFSPNVDASNVNYDTSLSIQELPIQSAICSPTEDTKLEKGAYTTVKGYAFSGGGKGIVRVDVSLDGGNTWNTAELKKPIQEKRNRAWSWTPWELDVELPEDADSVELVCKAVDSSYNSQPESSSPIWNLRGVLSHAWHRVPIQLLEADESEEF